MDVYIVMFLRMYWCYSLIFQFYIQSWISLSLSDLTSLSLHPSISSLPPLLPHPFFLLPPPPPLQPTHLYYAFVLLNCNKECYKNFRFIMSDWWGTPFLFSYKTRLWRYLISTLFAFKCASSFIFEVCVCVIPVVTSWLYFNHCWIGLWLESAD